MALRVYESMEQGSPEWLQARAGIVTASTVGKLLTAGGKVASNDTSRALIETLIAERITGRVEPIFPSRDMQRGTLLEPEARRLYEGYHYPVQEVGFMVWEEPGIKLGYSPDGLTGDDESEGLIEIKSRTPRIHLRTIYTDTVPAENMAQLQAGMLVADKPWIDYISYSPGLPLYVKRVEPIPAWQTAICEAVERFEKIAEDQVYEYHALTHNMPPTDWWDPFDEGEEIY